MNNYFIIPGLGNSGPEHWQSYFEQTGNNFRRINQEEWDAPTCSHWIPNVEKALSGYDLSTVILIGHSLGCITIAHWAKQYNRTVKGALLVAPSDIETHLLHFPGTGFNPIPLEKLNFKTIVVASENDPWITSERAKYFADSWGSAFISIGKAGHINAASGYGEWNEGLKILEKLM